MGGSRCHTVHPDFRVLRRPDAEWHEGIGAVRQVRIRATAHRSLGQDGGGSTWRGATGPLTEPVGVGAAWVAAPDAVGPATTGPESIFAAAANGAAAIAAPDANAARADDNANLVMAVFVSPVFSCLATSLSFDEEIASGLHERITGGEGTYSTDPVCSVPPVAGRIH